MPDDIYDVPSNSMKSKEEQKQQTELAAQEAANHPGIKPRKKGIGYFLRQLGGKDDLDNVVNIFGNAMINAIGDTIDEVTGNLTHRAKSLLYGTEDYNRASNANRGNRYNSYSKYYDDRNNRNNNSNRPTGSSGIKNTNNSNSENTNKKWKYNDVYFDQRVFGGKRGAELAAWRVIRAMDAQISDPDIECVSVADFFRYCKQEDPENPMLVTEFTDERWGWDSEEVIRNLQPIAVPGGFIIELPKPKSFY